MERRLEVITSSRDLKGEHLGELIRKEIGISLSSSHFVEVYSLDEQLTEEELGLLGNEVLADPSYQRSSYENPAFRNLWRIEIRAFPGANDAMGAMAAEAIKDRLGRDIGVGYSRMYALEGELSVEICDSIASILRNNPCERYLIHQPGASPRPFPDSDDEKHTPTVQKISLHMSMNRFDSLVKERGLSLSHDEFMAIKRYFKLDRVVERRRRMGLDTRITDVELELISHLWSECNRSKILNARIKYDEEGENHAINSLFNTFISGATEQVKKPYVISAFKDECGIMKFNHEYDIAVKVSQFDPSNNKVLASILSAQCGIIGTGLGAEPIADEDVICVGDLQTEDSQKNIMHPKTVFDNIINGLEESNGTGIPIVNGSMLFENGYNFTPILYCGSMGVMPSSLKGRHTSEKHVAKGYLAVLVGEKRSGLAENDIFNHTKTLDFVIKARNELLFSAISCNNLYSGMSELAFISGGCELYLDKCPAERKDMDPWEILVSESPGQMILAVPSENLEMLKQVASSHKVKTKVLGKFTHSGRFHVLYNDKTIAYLDMRFLINGHPQLKLKASWKKLLFPEPVIPESNPEELLFRLLSSPGITSKEKLIRRFDHEAKGISVIKPYMFGPSDAAVIRPVYNSEEGLVISHGICPRYVQDGYAMASLAFDEAVRNAIAAGARFGYLACSCSFSWPDPVKSDMTPDGEHKLGNLVRSCIALYDCATSYNIPILSERNGLQNDYYYGEKKYSIPPTLLVTVLGKMSNIDKALSTEFQTPGDYVYVLGTTKDELGGSGLYLLFGGTGNNPPSVDIDSNVQLYKALSKAIEEGVIVSAHDVSDGGIAVSFAECAIGFGLGADIDLDLIDSTTTEDISLMFSESAGRFIVSVKPENVKKFEYIMSNTTFRKAGRVRGDRRFIIRKGDDVLVNKPVEDVRTAYGKGL